MKDTYPISWWEFTGRMGPWTDGPPPAVRSCSPILRNLRTGVEVELHDLPVGACWDARAADATYADRPADSWPPVGADGKSIVCLVPGDLKGHHWYIDSRANNCTKPSDKTHRCWIRTGTVGDKITVGKGTNPAATCNAGAGSIAVPGWHGFLTDGVLVPC